jgi:hypothetical protein
MSASLVAGVGAAHAGTDSGSAPFSFVWVVPDSCEQLARGLTVTLDGTMRWVLTASGGMSTTVNGRAVDSAGNTYVFNYHNRFSGEPPFAEFSITDHFNLVGAGAAGGVHAHFTWSIKDGREHFDEHGGSLTLGCDPI